ncbi:hypothetical protein AAC387_Pa01g1631 [Persea americana]
MVDLSANRLSESLCGVFYTAHDLEEEEAKCGCLNKMEDLHYSPSFEIPSAPLHLHLQFFSPKNHSYHQGPKKE